MMRVYTCVSSSVSQAMSFLVRWFLPSLLQKRDFFQLLVASSMS